MTNISYIKHPNNFYNNCLKLYCKDKILFSKDTVIEQDHFGLDIKYKYDTEYINGLNLIILKKTILINL
jgi:hypothetical protein